VSRVPRLLPIVAVAIGGVFAVNAIAGASGLPTLLGGARAFAEEVAAKAPKLKKDAAAAKAEPVKMAAAGPLPPRNPAAPAAAAAQSTVCLPTDASIAKEAGLTPEQMRLLEGLQARRGQLDNREKSMEMQLTLLAAAEAKLDARIATLNGLKGDIQSLLGQADEKHKAETTRMVGVYTTMAQSKPKEAAKQLTILEDSVRLPIAAGLSNRTLATILANMQPTDAKKLNEALAHRFESQKLDAGRQAVSAAPAPAAPQQLAAAASPKPPAAKPVAAQVTDAATAPVKTAAAPPKPRRPAPKPAVKKDDPADAAAPMQTAPSVPAPAAPAAPALAPAEKAAAG
jgi:flagellar motility protein MotE (MotC chaperone)